MNTRKVSFFAISVGAHALLLAWAVAQPVQFGSGANDTRSAARFDVSILSSDAGRGPVPPRPSYAVKNTRLPIPVADHRNSIAHVKTNKTNTTNSLPSIPLYHQAEDVTRMPEAVSKFEPHLRLAEDSGMGGKLSIRLWISEFGTVDRISLLDTDLPDAFAEAAISAFREMRFSPGEIQGYPVKVWADIVIEYADLLKRLDVTEAEVTEGEPRGKVSSL